MQALERKESWVEEREMAMQMREKYEGERREK